MPVGNLNQPAGVLDNPNFKRWFGESKVVDKNGNPLVVYHGTQSNFHIINLEKVRDLGFHMGTEGQAISFAAGSSPSIMSLYASIERPLHLKDTFDCKFTSAQDTIWQVEKLGVVDTEKANELRRFLLINYQGNNYQDKKGCLWRVWESIRRSILDAGYDGVRYDSGNEREGVGKSWIVFDSRQIKSSTANNGLFDLNNPDITQ